MPIDLRLEQEDVDDDHDKVMFDILVCKRLANGLCRRTHAARVWVLPPATYTLRQLDISWAIDGEQAVHSAATLDAYGHIGRGARSTWV